MTFETSPSLSRATTRVFLVLCFMVCISRCRGTRTHLRSLSSGFRSTFVGASNLRKTAATKPQIIDLEAAASFRSPTDAGSFAKSRRITDITLPSTLVRTMSASASTEGQVVPMVIDPFCYRQFSEHTEQSRNYGGTVFDISVKDFTEKVNQFYLEDKLVEGYAPFCKHLFIPNEGISNAQVNVLPITSDNEHLLRTRYEARNDKELPILSRYFPKDLVCGPDQPPLPKAKYLDLILYSREQIQKENESMGKDIDPTVTSPWGIVSIKAQDVDHELPMQPITMMRNALGKEEGGSGVKLDKDKYMESYNHWNIHAVIA